MTPRRTRVKICGMREARLVEAAVALGFDAIGFIFVAKSPRVISPAAAKEIVASLPPFVDAVGVFMDADLDQVLATIADCGLSTVQLHGSESPAYCASIPCPVLKTIPMRPGLSPADLLLLYRAYEDVVRGFLLDTFHQKLGGGTGQAFDWSQAVSPRPPKHFLLAGGLNPGNVGTAIAMARPYGVDVNSGVEREKAVKDPALMAALMAAVRLADDFDAKDLSGTPC